MRVENKFVFASYKNCTQEVDSGAEVKLIFSKGSAPSDGLHFVVRLLDNMKSISSRGLSQHDFNYCSMSLFLLCLF